MQTPTLLCCPAPPVRRHDRREDSLRRADRAGRARRASARPQRAPRDFPRRDRAPCRHAMRHRPARSVHRPPDPTPAQRRTVIYDGQRRLLAPRQAASLAGADGYEVRAVQSLIVLLLDHEPSADEIRRIQAQANQAREPVARRPAGAAARLLGEPAPRLREPDRIVAVSPRADLGISPKRAHNLASPARAPRSDPHPCR